MDSSLEPKGCLMALFDLSFTEFVTSKLIKGLYVLLLILIGIGLAGGVIVGLITMLTRSFIGGLASIIGAAIGAVIAAILARVWTELIMVVFRIVDNTTELVRQGRNRPQ